MTKSEKAKENKQRFIDEILNMFSNNMHDYESFILDLCKETLKTRTQKKLKEIL